MTSEYCRHSAVCSSFLTSHSYRTRASEHTPIGRVKNFLDSVWCTLIQLTDMDAGKFERSNLMISMLGEIPKLMMICYRYEKNQAGEDGLV